ncbi:MAG: hypothetical protein ISR82_00200 [Candidatus Marinimicrobia bacterium]|nr:hypothetical protein [Candidatus Neomarinimicrobiota bacterium]MBL7009624.1 hypothetical protein [Candidatus Neomarinimicrobiota bacterium]MBL7029633.1 hypothetical protein [Candidatus Neomarinimicrobiota bacterium]
MKKIKMLILLLISTLVYAQNSKFEKSSLPVQHSVFVELLGNGFLYSVNFEKYIKHNVSIRAGGMGFSKSGVTNKNQRAKVGMFLMPVMANYLMGNHNHKMEFGVGPLFFYVSTTSIDIKEINNIHGFGVRATARMGYVYLPQNGGLTFRLAYTPLMTDVFSHSVGLALGYSF